MPWWGWIIFGALLFGTELMIVDLQFYLIFVGISAIIVGLLDLTGLPWQPWVEWLTFAIIAISTKYLLRKQMLYKNRQ